MTNYDVRSTLSWSKTEQQLAETFRRWGVHRYRVEPNTNSKSLNSRYLLVSERAVTIRFWKARGAEPEREVIVSLDTQDSPAKNLRALYLCLEDLRMLDVRGVGQVAAAAYLQLEGPRDPVLRDPFEVLGLRPGASAEDIEAMFRVRAKAAHPDHGGSAAAMAELNSAKERALAEAK